MNEFLSDYIQSIGSRSREKIQSILSAAQVSKENIDGIAARVNDIKTRSILQFKPESYGGLITRTVIEDINRDSYQRLRELYNDSNDVSLLLDSHTAILSSEVKRQADQLDAFDKFIKNYNFMLADNNFYDSAYTESFNDDIQKEVSRLGLMNYDRSGVSFDLNQEILDVDQGTGTLTMSASFQSTYPLIPNILKTNCSSFETSNTGIDKSVTSDAGDGWRVAISSPRPIISSINDVDVKGAQYRIEYALHAAAPADSFSITPLADLPCQIASIKVYDEDNADHIELISETVELDRNKTFYFVQQNVSRIVIVLNQPIYTRGKLPPSKEEQQYKQVSETQKLERSMRPHKDRFQKAFQRIYKKFFLKKEQHRASLVRPVDRLDRYTEQANLSDSINHEEEAAYVYSNFKFRRTGYNIFDKWLVDKLFENQPDLLDRFSLKSAPTPRTKSNIPQVLSYDPIETESITVNSQNYEYSLGIRNVKLGITNNKNRGLFISKPVPLPVQSGEVRMRVDDTNFAYVNSYWDNPVITSIEYSVTNKASPTSEQDWIPILPSNQANREIVERLFPQSSGFARFRFPVSNNASISLFKNGFEIDLEETAFVRSDDGLVIVGVYIPNQIFSLNIDDYYTVSYLPAGDPSTINFEASGFAQNNLASAYDDSGAGEYFAGTTGSKNISIQNIPYVNYETLKSESGYSSTLGLTGAYQPITIVMNDGTIAQNFTNYIGLTQNELDSTSVNYQFLHSGRQIIFNKDIDQGFRVFYQYEPSYLRYRAIFRVNTPVKVSPSVNSLTIKAKLNASVLGSNSKKV